MTAFQTIIEHQEAAKRSAQRAQQNRAPAWKARQQANAAWHSAQARKLMGMED